MKNNFTIHRSVLKVLLVLVIIMIIGVLVFVGLLISGKSRLYRKSENKRPDMASVVPDWEEEVVQGSEEQTQNKPVVLIPPEEEFENWEEGDIRYKGVHYRYNDQMLSFLILGIDKEGTVKEAKNETDGGQSDAIFILTLNPKTKTASLIGINRDTMTDIDVYAPSGEFLMTTRAQLTLQHGYGDGKEISCERSVAAVSNLMYNLPIHGYCAINLGAIPKINDAVGGVELVSLETLTSGKKVLFTEGQKVHLKGQEATRYLQSRDCDSFESAGRRTERQKQYALAYADTAKKAVKKDPTVFVTLFNTVRKYLVTDVTVDEIAYFSTQIADYKLEASNIFSIPGETKMGDKFEEFYVDEKALYELMLKVFYDVIVD